MQGLAEGRFGLTFRILDKEYISQAAQAAGKAAPPAEPAQLELLAGGVGSDDDLASLAENELQAEEEAQVAAASAATAGPLDDATARPLFAREQRLLHEMTESPTGF